MKTLLFHNIKIGRGDKIFLEMDSQMDLFSFKQGLSLIVAPNGYGKSTILQAISGSLPLLSGKIEFKDKEQSVTNDSLYISEYLTFPKYIYPKEWIEFVIQKKIEDELFIEISKKFYFEHKMDSYLGRMSQGERRKVTWMCAYFSDKNFILMDEPLDGLDLLAMPVVKEIIEKWKFQKKLVIMISHQPYEILPLSEEVLFLQDKKFISVKNEIKNVLDFENTVKKYYLNSLKR